MKAATRRLPYVRNRVQDRGDNGGPYAVDGYRLVIFSVRLLPVFLGSGPGAIVRFRDSARQRKGRSPR